MKPVIRATAGETQMGGGSLQERTENKRKFKKKRNWTKSNGVKDEIRVA